MTLPHSSPLFTGREVELSRLATGLERVRVAWIYGVGGVGKTTLACAFAASLGCPVVFCDAGAAPLEALVDDARRELGPKSRPEPRTLPAKLDDLVRRVESKHAVWLVDDAHELGDELASELVEKLASSLRSGRAIFTSRHRLALRMRAPDRLELGLEGLSEDAARVLWASLDELYGRNSTFDTALCRSGGNPLLLRRAHAGPLAEEDLLGGELGALSEDSRELGLLLAVAARPLSPSALEALLPSGRLRPALRELVTSLIAEVDDRGSTRVHDLFRDALLARASDEAKNRTRVELVRALPRAGLPTASLLRETSRHLVALGDFAELDRFLLAHAEDAVRAGVTGELLRCMDSIPAASRSTSLSIERARAVGRHYDMPLAYEELARLYRATASPPPELGYAFGEAAYDVCRPAEAAETLAPLLDAAEVPANLRVKALVRWAAAMTLLGRGEEGRKRLREAGERADDPLLRARLALQEAMSLNGEERWEAAASTLGRARVLLSDQALDENAVYVPLTFAVAYMRAGRSDEARALLEKLDLDAPTEDDSAKIFILASRAMIALERGDRLGSLAHRLEVEHLNEALGGVHYYMTGTLWLARLLYVLGRRREARARIEPALNRARELGCVSLVERFERCAQYDPRMQLDSAAPVPSPAHVSEHVRARALALLERAVSDELAADDPAFAELSALAHGPGYALDRAIGALARAAIARREGRDDVARRAVSAAEREAASEAVDADVVAELEAWVRERTAANPQTESSAESVELDTSLHELCYTGARLSLKSRPVLRRLLYALAGEVGRVVSKERLVLAMWSLSYDPLRHDTPLWQNIRRLRQLLRPSGLTIEVDEEGYRLRAPASFRVLSFQGCQGHS